MPKVTYIYGDERIEAEVEKGKPLLRIGLDAGVPIEHACGGNGFCTTCMCRITQGMNQLNARNDREENMGVMDDPYRLTCQAEVEGDGDVVVELLDE